METAYYILSSAKKSDIYEKKTKQKQKQTKNTHTHSPSRAENSLFQLSDYYKTVSAYLSQGNDYLLKSYNFTHR